MSLPDWNDLPPAARKAAEEMAYYTWEVDYYQAGQCALDIYNAIKEHVPPEVFPLFQRPRMPDAAGRPQPEDGRPRVRVRAGRRVW